MMKNVQQRFSSTYHFKISKIFEFRYFGERERERVREEERCLFLCVCVLRRFVRVLLLLLLDIMESSKVCTHQLVLDSEEGTKVEPEIIRLCSGTSITVSF